MRKKIPIIGLVVCFVVLGLWLNRKPRWIIPAKVYLPGVLDLSENSQVLGWESEEIRSTDIIDAANQEREKQGSPILHPEPKLMKAAQMRAEVMMKYGHVDHQDPYEGLNLAAVLPRVDYKYVYASENIALAQGNAEGIIAGFLNSPNHKGNLLDKNLIETGVGVVKGNVSGNYVVIVAHLFAVPIDQAAYRGVQVSNGSEIGEVRDQISRLANEADGAGLKILTRQQEILDQLTNLADPNTPYSDYQFGLLREYKENWQELESSGFSAAGGSEGI